MRTNIDIDDAVLDAAMRAGPFKTKKDAVEAGLKLVARQAAYREVLRWEGKLRWDGDGDVGGDHDAAGLDAPAAAAAVACSQDQPAQTLHTGSGSATELLAAEPKPKRRHAGR